MLTLVWASAALEAASSAAPMIRDFMFSSQAVM
jgi:hypothetical protein